MQHLVLVLQLPAEQQLTQRALQPQRILLGLLLLAPLTQLLGLSRRLQSSGLLLLPQRRRTPLPLSQQLLLQLLSLPLAQHAGAIHALRLLRVLLSLLLQPGQQQLVLVLVLAIVVIVVLVQPVIDVAAGCRLVVVQLADGQRGARGLLEAGCGVRSKEGGEGLEGWLLPRGLAVVAGAGTDDEHVDWVERREREKVEGSVDGRTGVV